MPWIDYAIFALIALSAIIGLFRGFVREALSLLTWAAAIVVSLTFFRLVANYLEPYLGEPSMRDIAGFAGLFLGTLIVGGILNYLLSLLVRKTGIGGTDRLLGLIFGAARGGVIVTLLVMLAGLTSLPNDQWWQDSETLPHFERAVVWVQQFLPEDITGYLLNNAMALPEMAEQAGIMPEAGTTGANPPASARP